MGLKRSIRPSAGFEGFSGFVSPPNAGTSHPHGVENRGDAARGGAEETRDTLQTLHPRIPRATNGDGGPAAFEWLHGLLDALGSGRAYATSDMRQCPAHDDGRPSLHVSRGADGRVLVRCFASCDWKAIVSAIGIPSRYLYTAPPVDPAEYAASFLPDRIGKFREMKRSGGRGKGGADGLGRLVGVHDYGHNHRVMRYRKGDVKDMVWESKRGKVWMAGLFRFEGDERIAVKGADLPIYFERDAIAAVALGDPVILCESESSCDQIIRETGIVATTWAGGANAVQLPALEKVLGGYSGVVVIPDNDAPGLAALNTLRAAGLAPQRVMPAEGEDARDLLTRIGADKFRALVETKAREPMESRPTWMPTATEPLA